MDQRLAIAETARQGIGRTHTLLLALGGPARCSSPNRSGTWDTAPWRRRASTRFAKPSDLNQEGIRIALVQAGASVEYAKENWPKAEHILLSTGNLTAPFVEVAAGRVDVGVEDAWQARRFSAAQPGVTDLFGKEPYNVLPIN